MNIKRSSELIEQINKDREFVAIALGGLQECNYSRCKIFLGKKNVSIYSLEPTLKLVKEFPNEEIIDFELYPTEEVIEVSNNDHIKCGIIGFLLGDWIGALIGSFIGAMSQHKTIDVYNLTLITESESVCFQIKK